MELVYRSDFWNSNYISFFLYVYNIKLKSVLIILWIIYINRFREKNIWLYNVSKGVGCVEKCVRLLKLVD